MQIILLRSIFTANSTVGELFIDGQHECFTLEEIKGNGSKGFCILPGNYPVILAPSPKFLAVNDPWVQKFARLMPHIINVTMRTYIMFHWGNVPADTDGCVLLGLQKATDQVLESRAAFEDFYTKIYPAAEALSCRVSVIESGSRMFNNGDVQDAATNAN
jgi:Family of unknown function (DUF5675)